MIPNFPLPLSHSAIFLLTLQSLPNLTVPPQTPEHPPTHTHTTQHLSGVITSHFSLSHSQVPISSPNQKAPFSVSPHHLASGLAPNCIFHSSTSLPPGDITCTRLTFRHLLGTSHLILTTPLTPPAAHSPILAWDTAVPISLTNLHVHVNGGDSISLSPCSRPRRRRSLAAVFLCSLSNWPPSGKLRPMASQHLSPSSDPGLPLAPRI